MNFLEKIRDNKISQPIKPNLKIKIWEKAWVEETNKDKKTRKFTEQEKHFTSYSTK